jgi:molybdopterin synthase catalytic subunit
VFAIEGADIEQLQHTRRRRKMAKMMSNLRKELSRRGVLGTLMAWHRGYLRPGVETVLVGTDERGNRYFEATELPFGTA